MSVLENIYQGMTVSSGGSRHSPSASKIESAIDRIAGTFGLGLAESLIVLMQNTKGPGPSVQHVDVGLIEKPFIDPSLTRTQNALITKHGRPQVSVTLTNGCSFIIDEQITRDDLLARTRNMIAVPVDDAEQECMAFRAKRQSSYITGKGAVHMKDLVSPKELREILEALILAQAPILIKGAPGVGKTDIVTQACAAVNAELVVFHPVVSDPTDFKGMPWVQNGKAQFLPFHELQHLIDGPSAGKDVLVVLLDDLGQAAPAVQAAAMQLILARAINGHKVHDKVVFIAATNRKQDKAAVTGILEPVKSRFATILELEPQLDDWVEWAQEHDLPPEIVAFVRFQPDYLTKGFEPTALIKNSACPRTLANLARLYEVGLPKGKSARAAIVCGAVGEKCATAFLEFLNKYKLLPDLDAVLADPENAPIPSEIAVLWALTSALSYCASDPKLADPIIAYADRLKTSGHPEFCILLVRDAKRVGGDAFAETKAYVDFALANKKLLGGRR